MYNFFAHLSWRIFVVLTFHVILGRAHKVNVVHVNGSTTPLRFLPFAYATHQTEGLRRLVRSTETYGIQFNVLKLEKASQLNTLLCSIVVQFKDVVEKYKDQEDTILMRIDGYDMVFTTGSEGVLERFLEFDANILFGTEITCYPNIGMQYLYTEKEDGYKCLNGGLIIGYAPYLYQLFQYEIKTATYCDDQVHFSRLYMNPEIQQGLNIKLDYRAHFVQNLNLVPDKDYQLDFQDDDTEFVNVRFGTRPVLIHGHSLGGKLILNNIGNYIAKSWTEKEGCKACNEGRIHLETKQESEYPSVLVGIFVDHATPFLGEMLQKVSNLNYPKSRMFLYVYNKVPEHEDLLIEWVVSHEREYLSTKFPLSGEDMSHVDAKHFALNMCVEVSCDVFFNVESEAHFDNPDTLNLLVSYNRSILAPVMTRQDILHSTFWGTAERWGTYKRSFDYLDIVKGTRRGIWNVAYVYGAYVIWRPVFENQERFGYRTIYHGSPTDRDAAFAYNNKLKSQVMYAVNYEGYGSLTDASYNLAPSKINNDLWQLKTNRNYWEKKYLHPKYKQILQDSVLRKEVCTTGDVYTFPLFNERFSKDLKTLLRRGNNTQKKKAAFDARTDGDVGLSQLEDAGFDEEWKDIQQLYIRPLEEIVTECDREKNVWTNCVLQRAKYEVRIDIRDSNQCQVWKIPNRECSAILPVRHVGWATLRAHGHTPKLHWGDGVRHDLVVFN